MTHKERLDRRLRVITMVKNNKSLDTISEEECLSIAYIQHICYMSNIPIIKTDFTYHQPKSVLAILGLLFTTTLSQNQIAEKLHISRQRVSQVYLSARKEGVPVPERTKGNKKNINAIV